MSKSAKDIQLLIEASEPPLCRICMDESKPGGLIAPCACRGALEFVHNECLNQWLNVSKRKSCEICQVKYVAQLCGLKPFTEWWRWPIGVIPPRMATLIFFWVSCCLIIIGCICYQFYYTYKAGWPSNMVSILIMETMIATVMTLLSILPCVNLMKLVTRWLESLAVYRWKDFSASKKKSLDRNSRHNLPIVV